MNRSDNPVTDPAFVANPTLSIRGKGCLDKASFIPSVEVSRCGVEVLVVACGLGVD